MTVLSVIFALFALTAVAGLLRALGPHGAVARRRRLAPLIARNLDDHFPGLSGVLGPHACRRLYGEYGRYRNAVAKAVARGDGTASIARSAYFKSLPADFGARIDDEDLTWRRFVQSIRNGALQAGGVPYRWFIDHDGHMVQQPVDPAGPEPRPYLTF